MSESSFWKRFRDATPGIKWQRITDRLTPGLPDTFWVHRKSSLTGAAEFKSLSAFPDGTAESGKKSSYGTTKEQDAWLSAWRRAGGSAFLIVYVRPTILLYEPNTDVPRAYTCLARSSSIAMIQTRMLKEHPLAPFIPKDRFDD